MIEPLLQAERLLLHGLVDQAEQIYRRTLESDPRNAIAAVGLAKVALERDDFAGAYGHACHALEIDRDNPSALRLEARLSEVLSARGQPVERPPWLLSASAATSNPQAPTSEEQAAGGVPPIAERGSGESSTGGRAPGSERAVFARNRSISIR